MGPLRRLSALALAVALSVAGIPLPAHAADEESRPARVLTWHGQPLSEVRGHVGASLARTQRLDGGPRLIVLSQAQNQVGAQPGDAPQGMSGRKKFWIAAGIGGATGALLGWAVGAEHCRNETTSVDPDQNCVISTSSAAFGAIFGLLGLGIGAGIGALVAK